MERNGFIQCIIYIRWKWDAISDRSWVILSPPRVIHLWVFIGLYWFLRITMEIWLSQCVPAHPVGGVSNWFPTANILIPIFQSHAGGQRWKPEYLELSENLSSYTFEFAAGPLMCRHVRYLITNKIGAPQCSMPAQHSIRSSDILIRTISNKIFALKMKMPNSPIQSGGFNNFYFQYNFQAQLKILLIWLSFIVLVVKQCRDCKNPATFIFKDFDWDFHFYIKSVQVSFLNFNHPLPL